MFSKCSNDDKNTPQKTVHNRYSYMAASVMMAITGISSNVLGKDEFLKFVCGTDDNNGMFSSLFSFSVSLSLLMYSRILEHTHTHTHIHTQIQSALRGEYVTFFFSSLEYPETHHTHTNRYRQVQ